ncbi:hypothetical protein [Paraferrimonas haliotis]|uniref:Uncharacterized protein n=1 Tax=Paraferrimonas haliotis TaxID=2013866 RepID=A0AA37TPH1_9GAMM|nr:hypothetical protein [Paraferrimonas haliotis]GLS83243.1 hypothetical protein GCM10007894_12200 [Paraferrimonas haliotis]
MEANKQKGGRPKKSEQQKRAHRVMLYFNDKELSQVKALAGDEALASWIRRKALGK